VRAVPTQANLSVLPRGTAHAIEFVEGLPAVGVRLCSPHRIYIAWQNAADVV
jgi:hypothetical protein